MGNSTQCTDNTAENGAGGGGDDSIFEGIRLIPALQGEPRVYDLDLGARLGFQREHAIRQIIERNLNEMAGYGEVVRASTALQQAFRLERGFPRGVENPNGGSTLFFASIEDWFASGSGPQRPASSPDRGGRPGRGYLLNENQALLITILSRTPTAAMVRRQVIAAYKAYRAGLAQPEPAPQPKPRRDLPPRPEDAKVLDLLASAVRVLDRQGRIIERQQMQMDALARRLDRADARADGAEARLGRAEARATAVENRVAAMEMAPAVPVPQTSPMAFRPNDLLGRFLTGCTDPDPLGQTAGRALYLAWCEWCRSAGLAPGSETRFGRAMKAHGADFRKSSYVFYLGFKLRERAAWAPASVVQRDGGAA